MKKQLFFSFCRALQLFIVLLFAFSVRANAQCVPADCNDNDACTTDQCFCFLGCGCLHFPVSCPDDGNFCTDDVCLNGACTTVPHVCDDGNPCTTDECSNNQCLSAFSGNHPCDSPAVCCNDLDPCTIDTCDANGACANVPLDCDDGDPCSIDQCNQGVCQSTPFNPNACALSPNCCDDGVDCTVDVCNTSIGLFGACQYGDTCQTHGADCSTDADCDDGLACTIDDCFSISIPGFPSGSSCIYFPQCDDGNFCTIDSCKAQGCVYTPIVCDDGNACTTDVCDFAGTGNCVHDNVPNGSVCTDYNLCTDNACNNGVCQSEYNTDPCSNPSVCCNDNDPCTTDQCDASGACVHVPKCDDGDPCTSDACDQGTCQIIPFNPDFCAGSPACCDDGNDCTVDFCSTSSNIFGTCVSNDTCSATPDCQTDADCDDGLACTIDDCFSISIPGFPSGSSCINFSQCDDGNFCTIDSCKAEGCVYTPRTCDDGNACTDDSCDPSTDCVYTNNTSPCSDGVGCTLNDVCSNGNCIPGAPKDCDDGNICSYDHCEGIAAECFHDPGNNGAPCNDGDACTVNEYCFNTSCTFGEPNDCDDGNACSVDACSNGVCVYTPNVGPNCCSFPANCYDGNDCTTDVCNDFQCENVLDCRTGGASCCNDGSACTQDFCDMATGNCQHKADCLNDISCCNDNDACTFDQCQSHGTYGTCVNINTCSLNACTFNFCTPTIPPVCTFQPVDCSGGNKCVTATCDPVAGCIITAIDCNDYDACTDDVCNPATGCANTAKTCDDSDACTDNSCDPATGGCIYQNNSNPCADDGNDCTADYCVSGHCYTPEFDTYPCYDLCTSGGVCEQGLCLHGTPTNCDDDDACTLDGCDLVTGCTTSPISCDDGDTCTLDNCDPSLGCVHSDNPNCANPCDTLDCDDADACTNDSCDPATGCVNNPKDCNDNNACTGDFCLVNGTCGYFFSCDNNPGFCCDDHDACTFDGCADQTHCVNVSTCNPCDTLDCDDGNACTDDSCDPATGGCIHQENSNPCPDDGNVCTLDACYLGACQDPYILDGVPCKDDNLCLDAVCYQGLCVTTSPATCNDSDACTDDVCNPASGCIYTPLSCDDRNLCTIDACYPATGCTHERKDCSDGNACTDDSCDPATGCVNAQKNCNDGNACNGVETCNPSTGCVAGTPLSCNDGNACNGVETCNPSTGCVQGTPLNCNDGNACNGVETCNPSTGCVAGTPLNCNDGNACNGVETCNPSTGCVAGTPVNCDDGSACTNDQCNPSNGSCSHTNVSAFTITGFTLVYENTIGEIGPLTENKVIDKDTLCRFNIRADVCPSVVGSVKFQLTGAQVINKTENIAPYSLLGDAPPGDYNVWIPSVGNYTLKATAYSGPNGSGVAGTPFTVHFSVVDGSGSTATSCSPQTFNCNTLVCNDGNLCTIDNCNPSTGCVYTPKNCNDANACTNEVCNMGTGNCVYTPIICNDNNDCNGVETCNPSTGCAAGTPKNCNDNNACTTDGCSPATGNCVSAPIICNDNSSCTNDNCNPSSGCEFILNGSCCTRVVTSFTLVNSLTDTDIGTLNDHDVVSLALYPNINVRANLCTNTGTESVRFKLNSNSNFRTENDVPYALVGDAPPGDYHKWNVTPGDYTITATPYSGNGATGIVGTPKTITIHIINSSAKMDGEEEQIPSRELGMESVDAAQLSAYPNPFRDVVTISFSLAKMERVRLEIVGIDGRLLATLFDGTVDKNEMRQVEFRSGDLASGMYFYRMITESGVIENRKLLLVR